MSIAIIHESLYQTDGLTKIKLKPFVEQLANHVAKVFEQAYSKQQVSIHIPELLLDIDTAVPLGLIINELLTNAFKYASSIDGKGHIVIKVETLAEDVFLLVCSDSGKGIAKGIDFDEATTLGLRLIKGLATQLHGKAEYSYNNGSIFSVKFKKK